MDEFSTIVKSHHSKVEFGIKQQWELARFISYHCIAPHSKKGLKITDIVQFEWEKMSIEEMKKIDFDALFPKTLKDGTK